jgi:hypothetical protein
MTEKQRQDSSAADDPKLLDLGQVAAALDVPLYLVKLAVLNLGERIACEMGGTRHNKRLYGPQAVEKIQRHIERLKARRERATKEAESYWQGLAALRVKAGQLGALSGELHALFRSLRRVPPSVTAFIHTLPDEHLSLVMPLGVVLSPLWRTRWRASLAEAGLSGVGRGQEEALLALREEIVRAYRAWREEPAGTPPAWAVLEQLIRPKRKRRGKEVADAVLSADERNG